jgi:phosphatidylglycerol:prolipoprotein diacylglycerol transferase
VHPVLIWLGSIPVRAYGAFVGAALVTGMSLCVRYARRVGIPGERMLDATYASVVAGLIGARLMYVLVHIGDFTNDPMAALRVWEGGMMYFGGLVMGIVVGSWAAIRLKVPIWSGVDCIAPAMGAGQAVGRIACLAAGCCYGKKYAGMWSITFSDPLAAAPPHLALIPTQALQIGEGLLLWWFGAWMFKHRRWDGQAFLYTLAAAGVTRSLLEELRGDSARGFFMPSMFGESMPSSRVVGIALVAAAVGVTIVRTAKMRAAGSSGSGGVSPSRA